MKKYCKKCDTVKDTTEFSKDKYSKDGLQHWCKSCHHHPSLKSYKKRKTNKVIGFKDLRVTQCKKTTIADYSVTELVNELKKRGVTGTLNININI